MTTKHATATNADAYLLGIIDQIRQQVGDDVDAFRREFHGRIGDSHYCGKVKI